MNSESQADHAGDVESWLDNLDVDPRDARSGRHMRRIAAAAQVGDVAGLDAAVRDARADGDSWTMIGIASGLSGQAAAHRFGHSHGSHS